MKDSIGFAKELWEKWMVGSHDHENTYCALEEAYLQGVIDSSEDKDVTRYAKGELKLVLTDHERWNDFCNQ